MIVPVHIAGKKQCQTRRGTELNHWTPFCLHTTDSPSYGTAPLSYFECPMDEQEEEEEEEEEEEDSRLLIVPQGSAG